MVLVTSTDTPTAAPAAVYPKTFAEAEVVLAKALPGYTPRIPQQIGAKAVEEAMASGQHLLLQASTGTGKSLLTLIPAVCAGRRVIISTATKALQSQLVEKDIPFLIEHLMPFSWALLQGRSNYACLNRANLLLGQDPLVQKIIAKGQEEGFSGLREAFGFDIPQALWSEICSTQEDCSELKCFQVGNCFSASARRKATDAQVVVVNHSILAINLKMAAEGTTSMLGELDVVIVDEAHELGSFVKSALGVEITEASVLQMISQARNFAQEHFSTYSGTERLIEAGSKLGGAMTALWADMADVLGRENSLRLTPSIIAKHVESWEAVILASETFSIEMHKFGKTGTSKVDTRLRSLKARSINTALALSTIVTDDTGLTVRWLESRAAKGGRRMVLCSQPLDVSEFLGKNLFANSTAILVSATLKTTKGWEFTADEVGVSDYKALDVGSTFDYASQMRVFVPEMPEPAGKTRSAWEAVAPRMILDAVTASQGRALVLFTSIAAMNRAFDVVAPEVPFEIRKQGDAPTPVLSAWFKENNSSVLFATRSFMTGVDFQGSTCSLVILDKLPFSSPSDPVEEAMGEYITRRGGSPFADRSMPTMALVLAQCAGRLIRHHDDKGVFMLMDSRAKTKSYGRQVLSTLPSCPSVSSMQELGSFLA